MCRSVKFLDSTLLQMYSKERDVKILECLMLFLVIGLCAISVGITLSLVALFTGISGLILWSIVAFCYLAAGISFTIDVFAFNEPIGFNYFFPRSRLVHLTDFFLWLAFWPLLLPIQYVFGYPYYIM